MWIYAIWVSPDDRARKSLEAFILLMLFWPQILILFLLLAFAGFTD